MTFFRTRQPGLMPLLRATFVVQFLLRNRQLTAGHEARQAQACSLAAASNLTRVIFFGPGF
jgi:hypothetical protein